MKLLYSIAGIMAAVILAMASAWALQVNSRLSEIQTKLSDYPSVFVQKDELALIFAAQADVFSKQIDRVILFLKAAENRVDDATE